MALHKKEKYSRPDKVSIRTIRGVSTAEMDWHTSAKDGVSTVKSRVKANNNSGSTTVENYSADGASGEID